MNSDFNLLGFAIAMFIVGMLFIWGVEYPEKMSKCIGHIISTIGHIMGIALVVFLIGGAIGILIEGWKHLWELF